MNLYLSLKILIQYHFNQINMSAFILKVFEVFVRRTTNFFFSNVKEPYRKKMNWCTRAGLTKMQKS